MKKSILLLLYVLFYFTDVIGQQYYMASPQGYGAATTGGGNASPITVTTYAALKTALMSTSPSVILVSGIIDFSNPGMIKEIITNKTLIGLPGAKFVNTNQSVSGILYLKNGSSNVIIRNLLFEGPGAWDNNGNDNLTCECTNLWVDHCEFQDGEDGNFDNKGNTDNVTISWCKFTYLKAPRSAGSGTSNDHRFSGLVGSSSNDAPADGHYSVTFQNCYWAMGCKERMPRARNAKLHILNCYYNTYSSGTKALGIGGGVNNSTVYVENSNFASVGTVYQSYNSTDGGSVALTFSGCLSGASNIGTVAAPTYTYMVFPVAQVATSVPNVTCGAGPTLLVTSGGVISSPCAVTGIVNTNATSEFVIYPNPSSESFYIRGIEDIKILSIINLVGEEIYKTEDIQGGKDTEIAANFEQGIYLIKIQYVSGATGTRKFIKTK